MLLEYGAKVSTTSCHGWRDGQKSHGGIAMTAMCRCAQPGKPESMQSGPSASQTIGPYLYLLTSEREGAPGARAAQCRGGGWVRSAAAPTAFPLEKLGENQHFSP